MKAWFLFAISASLFWGSYVPTIFYGQQAFGAANPNKSMKAFLFIGIAYFLMAVVVPGIWLAMNPSPADTGWPMRGMVLSTLAGVLGAAGALGVVFALRAAGPTNALYVAPVVFAGAPIINVLVSYLIQAVQGKAHPPHPVFFVGLILAIVGVVLVLLYSPAAHGPAKPAAASSDTASPTSQGH
jgi:hypothetical protein